jgi:hypothetical protein
MACGASSVAPRVAFSEYDENSILIGLPLEGSLRVASHGSLLRLTSRTIRRSLRSYLRSDCSGPGSFVGSDGIFFPRRISSAFHLVLLFAFSAKVFMQSMLPLHTVVHILHSILASL